MRGATRRRPRYVPDGLGGLPAVTFDGLDDYMELADFTGLKNAASYDIYFVATSTNSGGEGVVLAGVNGETGTAGAGDHGLLVQVNSTGNALRFNHRMPFAPSGGVNLTTASDLELTRLIPYRFTASGALDALFIAQDVTVSATVAGEVLAFDRDLDLTFGRLSGSQAIRHLKGAIGEILIYNSAKNGSTAAIVADYLKAHWPTPVAIQ